MIHYVSQLANALSKKEEVVLIAPVGMDKNNFAKDVKIIKLELGTDIKRVFINSLILTRPIKLLDTINCERPDVIHFNEAELWSSLFLPFLYKYPIVTTIHDVNPHKGSRKFDQVIGKKMHISFSDCIIVHGEKAKKDMKMNKKCYNIPHGDYSFFLNYKKNGVNEEERTILFFGRIEEYKGLEYLMNSMPFISTVYPDIKLIIAGSGDFNKYKNMIHDNRNYEIHNRFIPDEETPIFFQRSKIVILPYKEGTQTGIIPIAYAFKKPVIVTNIGSIPEVVDDGKTGFIIPPEDVNALAGAIIRMLKDDELRRQMGENGYIKMKEELSWDKIAQKMIDIYISTIHEHKNKDRLDKPI